MMRYERQFTLEAEPADVAAFHRRARSLRAITPLPMTIHAAPDPLESGDEITFTMWMGPLPVRWHGRIESVDGDGFDDVQVRGPFGSWRHRHRFEPVASGGTTVHDTVEVEMPFLLSPRYVIAALMWVGLPVLFVYRAWRTRALVERR